MWSKVCDVSITIGRIKVKIKLASIKNMSHPLAEAILKMRESIVMTGKVSSMNQDDMMKDEGVQQLRSSEGLQ